MTGKHRSGRRATHRTAVIEATRQLMGPVGAFLPEWPADPTPVEVQRNAVRALVAAGYPMTWTNEIIGKDALLQLSVLLSATHGMAFGTSIANIWARPPQTARAAAGLLAEAHPGRFVLGLGVGYPQQATSVGRSYGRPLSTMRSYLEAMDLESREPPVGYARLIAANGPKMQALGAEFADGVLPAGGTAEETAAARAAIGPTKLLVVYLDSGSAQGGPAVIAEAVGAHLSSGADHVILGAAMGSGFEGCVERLQLLAPAVL